ncbi:site-2 protease family protein [Chelatococcus asaccharovorans]|uniref:Zn-dependent protease n=1 Tax=Chelatococcus asaccharovorans TaxID=28210 RepID=A0A2V3U9L1_9HYPH|nr:site-2 protease family protein [Chelatococcus asaccharovorans]MBS7705973.1 site-2 protease family protein [Chelatococcus asaccharovorans]PXW58994.1 Zn-dependent protease [Chelatococcus asaccharovorans]
MTATGGTPENSERPSGRPAGQPAGKRAAVLRLGRIAGVPVEVDSGFLFVAVLLSTPYWLAGRPATMALGVAFVALLGISVLVHELAHSKVAGFFQIPSQAIRLNAFGGVAHLKAMPKTPWKTVAILLAGPLGNLLLYGLFEALQGLTTRETPPLLRAFLEVGSWINLSLGLFNLLPAFPLDGGRSAYVLLAPLMGNRASGLIIALCGLALVAALVVFSFNYGLWLIVIALILAQPNLAVLKNAWRHTA